MNKIQSGNLVFGISIFISLLIVSTNGFGSGSEQQLIHADSLFEANKYTESFEVYNTVLEQGDYTPGMLLKMAFIKEGLGDVSGAMYFLNQYYNLTSNKKVLAKLEEIARRWEIPPRCQCHQKDRPVRAGRSAGALPSKIRCCRRS